MAAYGCLVAIRKILDCPLKINTYKQAFVLIEPCITYCLSSDGLDYLDEGAPLLEIFVYKIYPLTEQL